MDRIRFLLLRVVLPGLITAGLFCLLSSAAKTQEPAESRSYDNNIPNDSAGPVRLARFSSVQGDVSWRADDQDEWSRAETNLPLRQGAQIYAPEGARAEIQFDDGSDLRLGSRALVDLHTMYSDAEGEFTQITLKDGTASLRLEHDHSVYQVDTPFASASARGPAKIRLTADDQVHIAVLSGRATVQGRDDKITLESGQYLALRDEYSRFEPREIPRPDSFDRWNSERDRYIAVSYSRPSHRYLPRSISRVAYDLDDYGSWRRDPQYGEVWCPRVSNSDWRPYRDGRWAWVNPFGWTWVSDEPWGWAPYHYGTWCHTSYGWGWAPGPSHQYWCPAVVNFCEYDGRVAWTPLCPSEVRYPSYLSIGFGGRDWSLYFSIGQAAVYYPTYSRWCEPRPFNTIYCNRVVNVTNVYNRTTFVNNYYNTTVINRNTYLSGGGRPFQPINARHGGVILASASTFGSHAHFQIASGDGSSFFRRGHVIAAPAAGHAPVAGPIAVRPRLRETSPSHSFLRGAAPSPRLDSRPVFSSPVNPRIVRGSRPILPSGAPAPVRERQVSGAPTARDVRGLREAPATGRQPGFARRDPLSTSVPPIIRQPESARGSFRAPNRNESVDRPGAGAFSRPDRGETFSSTRPRAPLQSGASSENRVPIRDRAPDRERAAEAAMNARRNLGLPTRERTAPQSPGVTLQRDSQRNPASDRNFDRPIRTSQRNGDTPRDRNSVAPRRVEPPARSDIPESPRRFDPPARQETPFQRGEDRRRAPEIRNLPSERSSERRIDQDAERPRRTIPGYEDAPRSRIQDAPRGVEPPVRQETPFSRNDTVRRAPEVRSYPSERPSYQRSEQVPERTRRPAETYSDPIRREPQYRPEPRRSPEPGAESRGRREPFYQPEVRRQPESYSQPPRREVPAYRQDIPRRAEPSGEAVRREAPQMRREPPRPMETPRREAAPTYRPQERAPDTRMRAKDSEQSRGGKSNEKPADSPDRRDRLSRP